MESGYVINICPLFQCGTSSFGDMRHEVVTIFLLQHSQAVPGDLVHGVLLQLRLPQGARYIPRLFLHHLYHHDQGMAVSYCTLSKFA